MFTIFRRECQVVVEELAELHDHVREPGVGQVGIGMILLRNESGIRETARGSSTSWHADTILDGTLKV